MLQWSTTTVSCAAFRIDRKNTDEEREGGRKKWRIWKKDLGEEV